MNVDTLCVFVCICMGVCGAVCVCVCMCICLFVSLTLWLYQFWHLRPDLVTEVKPMYSVPSSFWIQSTFVFGTDELAGRPVVGTVVLRTAKTNILGFVS